MGQKQREANPIRAASEDLAGSHQNLQAGKGLVSTAGGDSAKLC